MSYIDAPVEERGTPEYYELLACQVTPLNPFEGCGLKPYKVSDAMAVGEMCDKAALAPYPLFLKAKYLAFYLNEGHISNTANIIQKYFSQLPAPFYMLPGNHEQYAPETWKAITGFDRYYTVPYGEFVFIMLDTFSGNLGPDFHSDGTYEPADVNYIRKVMTENPGKKFFLCAHDFYTHEESEGFKKLLKEPDILGLFAGHTHESRVFWLGEEFGKKCLIRTGNYAYSHAFEGQFASWGWRELKTDVAHRKVFTEYILPETVYTVKVLYIYSK